MRTIKIQVDGKEHEAQVFKGMWEYIDHYGSDITHYALDPAPYQGEKITGGFKPIEDVDFGTHSSDLVEIDGKYYQHVNWGEEEYALIPEADLEAEFWTVYEWNGKTGYDCTGQIFQTEEEAQKEVA